MKNDSPFGYAVFDLGRILDPRMPHHAAQVPLMHRLTKLHGSGTYPGGVTAANDVITMGLHNGTHVDAIGHFAVDMNLWEGADAATHQDPLAGLLGGYGIESFRRLVWHAVMADVPSYLSVPALPEDHRITRAELQGSLGPDPPIREGSALVIRTGWGADWPDRVYGSAQPGPDADAAAWACDLGVRLLGSDTLAFEWTGDPARSVHRLALVKRGMHIVEGLDLEQLAAAGVREFLMVVTPIAIRGGTAGRVRPVALVPG